jgi:uncharacterized protein YdeI (YjbR/CyaY-like superfamily)
MPPRMSNTLHLKTRHAWRKWLQEHQGSVREVWLVFAKRHTGLGSLSYDDAVEEAICFGWIDSLVRGLDEDRYARKFTPRKADSRWSTANRRRYADLKSRGLLAAAGLSRAPTGRSGDAPRPSVSRLPPYLEQALKANPLAREHFGLLAPSCRRAYIGWIDSAKRNATRDRRLREALDLLEKGEKLGLK